MAIYRPFVDAVRWLGTNVIEIRQFVRANQGYFNDAVIQDGTLYLQARVPDPIAGSVQIAVPLNDWVVRSGADIRPMTDSVFTSQFTVEVAATPTTFIR